MKFSSIVALVAIAIVSVSAESKNDVTQTSDECSFTCPDVENPVCGSDGVSYSNKCFLSRAACKSDDDITKASDGECADSSADASSAGSDTPFKTCNFACTILQVIDQPVTDEKGNWYPSKCEMSKAKCRERNGIATPTTKPVFRGGFGIIDV